MNDTITHLHPRHGDVYLDPGDAAQRLGVSTHTLARWADDGLLTVHRPHGRRHYRAAEVDLLAHVHSLSDECDQLRRQLTDMRRREEQARRLAAQLARTVNRLATLTAHP